MDLIQRTDVMKSTYYQPYEYFLLKILYRNAVENVLSLFHENLNVLLYILYKIINKIYIKVIIAQNDTDLSCINLNINVLKCFTKAQYFKTLI